MKGAQTIKNEVVKKTSTPLKKRGLNAREMKFAAGIIKGLTAAEAMRQAGYAETTSTHKQAEKLSKVGVHLAELMEKRGLTEDRLLDVLENGLRATKSISPIWFA